MGGAGAAAAEGEEVRPSAEVDEAAAHRWDQVAGAGGLAVAGCTTAVRAVADGVWAVPSVATRRELVADPDRVAGTRGRGRTGYLGCQRRLDDRQGASARGGRAEKGDLQKESHPAGCRSNRPITRWVARGWVD